MSMILFTYTKRDLCAEQSSLSKETIREPHFMLCTETRLIPGSGVLTGLWTLFISYVHSQFIFLHNRTGHVISYCTSVDCLPVPPVSPQFVIAPLLFRRIPRGL